MSDVERVVERAAALLASGARFALVTVVATKGSTPRKPGAKMIVTEDGASFGTIGGGRFEHELAAAARDALTTGRAKLVRFHLTHDLAMCCGGEMEAFVEPIGGRDVLVLVGAGHVNAALAAVAARLDFELIVVDDLEELTEPARFPPGTRFVSSFAPKEWNVALGARTYVVVATRDHGVDQDVIEDLAPLAGELRYLGVIGSRGKLGRFRRRFESKGIPAEFITRVRGPIGVDVGAETPEEIAVAVAAELVAVRRRGADVSVR